MNISLTDNERKSALLYKYSMIILNFKPLICETFSFNVIGGYDCMQKFEAYN